jgi:hypothetical protein
MPRKTTDTIQYSDALTPSGIRFQASPPVCNLCGQTITRETFGCSYVETEEQKKTKEVQQFERIECTACTAIRESGEPLLTFVNRHSL